MLSKNSNLEFEDSRITASIRKESIRHQLDTKRLKEELPDVYEEYSKEVVASTAITMKYNIND